MFRPPGLAWPRTRLEGLGVGFSQILLAGMGNTARQGAIGPGALGTDSYPQ